MRIPARLPVGLLMAIGALPLVYADGRPQITTFSTHVEAVRVDVLVTENAAPVRGLHAADFEVWDNGVRQRVDLTSIERLPIHAVLALDMSDSVAGQRLDHLREAGQAVLGALKPEDQAALVTFNDIVARGSKLTTNLDGIRTALNQAQGSGNTALVDGIFAAVIVGESNVARGLVIIFSDGLDTSSWLSPELVLQTAARAEVVVYGFSVGRAAPGARDARRGPLAKSPAAGNPFLRDVTRATGGTLYESESTTDLPATFLRIINEFRERYVLSYSPTGVSASGWHAIQVRVKGRAATVRARTGYMVGG